MFCNETDRTLRKAGATASAPLRGFESTSNGGTGRKQLPAQFTFTGPTHFEPTPQYGLDTSHDDLALGHFHAHHILRPASASGYGRITDEGLLMSMKALGMASYSTSARSAQLMTAARVFYLNAIQQTNAALACADRATRDSTLLSVIILSYFESTTGTDKRSLIAWSDHIKGTAALIEMRGPEQIQSNEGRLLFMQATSNLMSNCLRNNLRVPSSIRSIMNEADKYRNDPGDPVGRVHTAMLDLTDFYSDVMNGRTTDVKLLIGTALKLDHRLSTAFDEAPPEWACNTISTTDGSFPPYYLVYADSLSAQIHNSMRNGRIIAHEIVLLTLKKVMSLCPELATQANATQVAASRAVSQDLSVQILASVKQHIGMDCAEISSSGRNASHPNHNDEETIPAPSQGVSHLLRLPNQNLPVLRTSKRYSLMWSLTLVASVSSSTSEMRRCACRMLRLVGRRLGVQHALLLADEYSGQCASES